MSVPGPLLSWDFAGCDGLALARELFGSAVSELSVYRSLDTDWKGTPCALLRLCENNFRVGLYENIAARDVKAFEDALWANAATCRVWVKPTILATLLLNEDTLKSLLPITTVKSPHRLIRLGQNRAIPCRIAGLASLLWCHRVGGVLAVEVQTAPSAVTRISAAISQKGVSPVTAYFNG